MKKLFAIIAVCIVAMSSFNANAQLSGIDGMPPYKLGVTLGLNVSNLSGSFEASSAESNGTVKTHTSSYSVETGFQIGLNLMVDASPLLSNSFARAEVKYSQKGATSHIGVINGGSKVSTHYIEIPIHYGYAWYINDYVSVLAETGPYFAFAFSGTQQLSSTENPNFNHKWGVFDFRDGNRFDMGWGIQASAMFLKDYQFHIGYDYGFINVTNDFLQNRNFHIGLTWFFESLFEY